MSIQENLTDRTNLSDSLTGNLLVAIESQVSIYTAEFNRQDQPVANLSDTLTGGLLVACESRVSVEKNFTDRTNLSDTLTGGLLVACESRVSVE